MFTEAKQILIENFYFNVPSNELHCRAGRSWSHTRVAEGGEEIYSEGFFITPWSPSRWLTRYSTEK